MTKHNFLKLFSLFIVSIISAAIFMCALSFAACASSVGDGGAAYGSPPGAAVPSDSQAAPYNNAPPSDVTSDEVGDKSNNQNGAGEEGGSGNQNTDEGSEKSENTETDTSSQSESDVETDVGKSESTADGGVSPSRWAAVAVTIAAVAAVILFSVIFLPKRNMPHDSENSFSNNDDKNIR